MKIAIYSHSIAPSIDGVCRRFTAILHELEKQNYETLLFTMEESPEDLPASTKFVTIDHFIFPTYPNKKVAYPSVSSFYTILSTIRRERPDVIHVVSDGFSHMFTLVGLLLGIPVVGSFHTDLLDLLNTHDAYWFQKAFIVIKEAADSIVLDSCATTSFSFKNKLKQQAVHCEHVIMTAVDTTNFSVVHRNEKLRLEMMFDDSDGFLCVYAGRISNEKRLDVIIDALSGLTGDRKAYLAIVGDGPSASVYAKLHGKENRIYCKPQFLNHKDLAIVYASSDIHVSASQFETLGNTVLEAFASSIPVVVPHTQGFSDTVTHEVDGFLFRPADRDDARRYIQLLKDDRNLQMVMGLRARAAVDNRTIEHVVKDLLEWYQVGKERRSWRGYCSFVASLILMLVTVPIAVIAFAIYNLINRLLKPFRSYGTTYHVATTPASVYKED